MKFSTLATSSFLNRTHSNMKTTPTCFAPSRSSGAAKADENCRATKASLLPSLPDRARASWSAAVLRRFAFTVLTALSLLALLGAVDRASAQGLATGTVPERLSFQGYMADANGIPLGSNAPVNLPVVFRIFPSATGGTTNWSERQIVTFDRGNYSVVLGQGAAVGSEPRPNLSDVVIAAAGNLLYVETTVTINGTDEKILPRLRLLPTPYAFLTTRALRADSTLRADSAVRADSATTATSATNLSGTLPATQLSGTLTQAQIPNLDAGKLTTGTLSDARLGGNVARRDQPNAFTELQSFLGDQNVFGSSVIHGRSIIFGSETIMTNQIVGNNLFVTNHLVVVKGNLTVSNNLILGSSGQLKAAGGDESLRIVRGLVKLTDDGNFTPFPYGAAGTTNAFSVVRTANGNYRITFQPAFNGEPSVTVCPIFSTSFGPNPDDAFAQIRGLTSSYVDINFLKPNVGAGFRLPFSFIAVGPR